MTYEIRLYGINRELNQNLTFDPAPHNKPDLRSNKICRELKGNHLARIINQVVKDLKVEDSYIFGHHLRKAVGSVLVNEQRI